MIDCVCRWQNLVTRAEERHKLVTASLNFYKTAEQVSSTHRFIAIYGPLFYTAPYVMFMMREDPLRGRVGGGWDLEIETFLGPEMTTSEANAICSTFFLPHCSPPPHLPHLYTALYNTQCSELESQNLLEINRKQ